MQDAGRDRGVVAPGGVLLLAPDHVERGTGARPVGGVPKKRGPARRVTDPRDQRITELEREGTRWRKRAERAEALVELQKQVAALLGTPITEPS